MKAARARTNPGALALAAVLALGAAACEARPGEPARVVEPANVAAHEAAGPGVPGADAPQIGDFVPVDGGASALAELLDRAGRTIGRVTLEQGADGVFLRGSVEGLTAGAHALHFHETGRCEPPFETAGGHFNPGGRRHGLLSAAGPHAGDLPNVRVRGDGTSEFEMFAPLVTLRGGPQALLDNDGTALVLHAGEDDHRTDPSGNSGDRIACGVIR